MERIEISRRLVGDDDFRTMDHRARDRNALALAAGKLVRKILHLVAKAHHVEHLRHQFAISRCGLPATSSANATFS